MENIIADAIKTRDSNIGFLCSYKCHTDTPYSDGYGDDKYGDYADSESYSDDGD